MKIKIRSWLIACTVCVGVSFCSMASAENLTTNLTWCAANSGSIAISLSECNGLAHIYNQTNGDQWNYTGNWFSNTDLSTWAHPAGSFYGF